MDHAPNKEVTRAVGWGRGGGGQTPNHGSATPSGRLSTRKRPCAEAQGQEAPLCGRVHCSGCRWGRAEVDGSCPEHMLGCTARGADGDAQKWTAAAQSTRWAARSGAATCGGGTRTALLPEPPLAAASSPCPDTHTHTAVLVPTSVPLSFPLKPTLFFSSCSFSVVNSGD